MQIQRKVRVRPLAKELQQPSLKIEDCEQEQVPSTRRYIPKIRTKVTQQEWLQFLRERLRDKGQSEEWIEKRVTGLQKQLDRGQRVYGEICEQG